ncbi:MAG TPA: hypothetical protein PKM43_08515 [Verrucomicrobiota bacterium]|nr:hypothetical protein [Verrucomicrobiota bacterium]
MKKGILITLLVPLIVGCGGLGRPLLDGTAGGGAAILGHTLSDGNPLITGASAFGGVALAEGAQALVSSGQKKAFNSGYQKGQSDAVKLWYHELRNSQRLPTKP